MDQRELPYLVRTDIKHTLGEMAHCYAFRLDDRPVRMASLIPGVRFARVSWGSTIDMIRIVMAMGLDGQVLHRIIEIPWRLFDAMDYPRNHIDLCRQIDHALEPAVGPPVRYMTSPESAAADYLDWTPPMHLRRYPSHEDGDEVLRYV